MLVAVVTGSSSGIGARTAEVLAAQGYCVVLHGHRNLAGLHATAGRILTQAEQAERDVQVICVTGNLADPVARRDLVQAAFAWKGAVAAWINNAGVDVLTGDVSKLGFSERLELLWRVDVEGTIDLSRMVTDRMRRQSMRESGVGQCSAAPARMKLPTIVNIGWDQAMLGMEGEAGQLFAPTKGAIMAFTQSLALSASPWLRVNCIAPGWIRTSWGSDSASGYWDERARRESTLERWGTPDDVAQAIGWLVSPMSSFVNGQTLVVNGGRRFYPARSDRPAAD